MSCATAGAALAPRASVAFGGWGDCASGKPWTGIGSVLKAGPEGGAALSPTLTDPGDAASGAADRPGPETAMIGDGEAGMVRGVAPAGELGGTDASGAKTLAATVTVSRSSAGSGPDAGARDWPGEAPGASGVPQKRQNSAPAALAPRQREQMGPIGLRRAEPALSPLETSSGGEIVRGGAELGAAAAGAFSEAEGRGKSAPHILQKFIPDRLSTEQRGHGTTGPRGAADGRAPVSGIARRASMTPGTNVLAAAGAAPLTATTAAGSWVRRGESGEDASFCPQSWQNFKPSELFEPQCAQAGTASDWNPGQFPESRSVTSGPGA
ncbi:MAG: hypothetical protein HYY06_22340 [Deltaproteobacteria bacterium]|nr:hypothetical protein [Deltaproteobacteria bacterium]